MGFDGRGVDASTLPDTVMPATHVPAHAKDLIRAFVKRIQNLDEEIAEKNKAKADVYGEAKAMGLCKKTLRIVVQRAKKSSEEVLEADTLVELYERCLQPDPVKPARDPLDD